MKGIARRYFKGCCLFPFFCCLVVLSNCEEVLPPRSDPQNYLDVSVQGVEGRVVIPQPLLSTAGHFLVSVTNLYVEVLQAEENISVDIEFWLASQPSIGGTVHGDRNNLLNAHMIQEENLLTIEPDSTATFLLGMDHLGLKLWELTYVIFDSAPGNPYGKYWIQSNPIGLVVQGSVRLFKGVDSLVLPPVEFTIDYWIFVGPPVPPDGFRASYDSIGHSVLLEWSTEFERNNYGFTVEKGPDGMEFNTIGNLIRGQGTWDYPTDYAYRDTSGIITGMWYYRLLQWYEYGTIVLPAKYSDVVSVVVP